MISRPNRTKSRTVRGRQPKGIGGQIALLGGLAPRLGGRGWMIARADLTHPPKLRIRVIRFDSRAASFVSAARGFGVEPSEPQSGIGRFDLDDDFCFWYVGLRSQSLADPTLRYRALSGRRAGYR